MDETRKGEQRLVKVQVNQNKHCQQNNTLNNCINKGNLEKKKERINIEEGNNINGIMR